jgi:hypothetical protein
VKRDSRGRFAGSTGGSSGGSSGGGLGRRSRTKTTATQRTAGANRRGLAAARGRSTALGVTSEFGRTGNRGRKSGARATLTSPAATLSPSVRKQAAFASGSTRRSTGKLKLGAMTRDRKSYLKGEKIVNNAKTGMVLFKKLPSTKTRKMDHFSSRERSYWSSK